MHSYLYIDEGSLSSERLQHSAAPVQRVGTTISSSAGDDNQIRTQKSIFLHVAVYMVIYIVRIINQCLPSTEPPANRVALQELMKRYNLADEQLNTEIRNPNFSYLAIYFDDVEIYSNAMGLDLAEQADVKRLYHSEGTQVAMMKCLKIWKQHNSSQTTYRALLDIALSLGKGDTADKICQQLTQRKYMYISAPPPFPRPSNKQLSR